MVCLSPVGYMVFSPTGDKHTISTFVDQTHIQCAKCPYVLRNLLLIVVDLNKDIFCLLRHVFDRVAGGLKKAETIRLIMFSS